MAEDLKSLARFITSDCQKQSLKNRLKGFMAAVAEYGLPAFPLESEIVGEKTFLFRSSWKKQGVMGDVIYGKSVYNYRIESLWHDKLGCTSVFTINFSKVWDPT